MKRDADLIRAIAFETEKLASGADLQGLPGVSPEDFFEHVALMVDADLIEAITTPLIHGSGIAMVSRLTWKGHDFVAAARSETVWAKAKKSVIAPSVGWTIDTLLGWLAEEVKQSLPSINI